MEFPCGAMHVELHVPTFELVRVFYQELGFTLVREHASHDETGYMVMQYQRSAICFWPGNETVFAQSHFGGFDRDTTRGYGVEIVIMTTELEALHQRARSLGCIAGELKFRPWGLFDFRIVDPHGYYLRFTEPHDVLEKDRPPAARA